MSDQECEQLMKQEPIDTDDVRSLSVIPDYLTPDFRYQGEETELSEIGMTRAPGCNHISPPNEIDEAGFCVNCSEAQQ